MKEAVRVILGHIARLIAAHHVIRQLADLLRKFWLRPQSGKWSNCGHDWGGNLTGSIQGWHEKSAQMTNISLARICRSHKMNQVLRVLRDNF